MQLDEELRFWFDSRWRHWIFLLPLIFQPRYDLAVD
jgi:hypothetical protein